MNTVRVLLINETRDRWRAVRDMRHATEGEKQLAQVMMDECNKILSETKEKVSEAQ